MQIEWYQKLMNDLMVFNGKTSINMHPLKVHFCQMLSVTPTSDLSTSKSNQFIFVFHCTKL